MPQRRDNKKRQKSKHAEPQTSGEPIHLQDLELDPDYSDSDDIEQRNSPQTDEKRKKRNLGKHAVTPTSRHNQDRGHRNPSFLPDEDYGKGTKVDDYRDKRRASAIERENYAAKGALAAAIIGTRKKGGQLHTLDHGAGTPSADYDTGMPSVEFLDRSSKMSTRPKSDRDRAMADQKEAEKVGEMKMQGYYNSQPMDSCANSRDIGSGELDVDMLMKMTGSLRWRRRKSNLAWGINAAKGQMQLQEVAIDYEDSDAADSGDAVQVDDADAATMTPEQRKMSNTVSFHRKMHDIYNTRTKLMTQHNKQLTGFGRWKHQRSIELKNAKRRYREFLENFEVWRGSFKTIEGNFGSSVVSYFRFLKWLLILNMVICLLMLCVIVVPMLVITPSAFEDTITGNANGSTEYIKDAQRCSTIYVKIIDNGTRDASLAENVIGFLEGTGWMERTVLFYGYYFDKTRSWDGTPTKFDSQDYDYNMPLAYLLSVLVYFFLSLVLMVKYTATGVRESLAHSKDDAIYGFSHKVFVGWDYNLAKERAVKLKQKNWFRELRVDLAQQRRALKLTNMGTCDKMRLYTLRLVINIFVLAVLGGSGYVIYLTVLETTELAQDLKLEKDQSDFINLLVQFLPAFAITGLNVIVPLIFEKIVQLEDYTPETELKITIFRTVFLRLASLVVLVLSLCAQLCDLVEVPSVDNTTTSLELQCGGCGKPDVDGTLEQYPCWETFVGQQFYKLVLLDFIVVFAITFFVEFPRRFIVKRYGKMSIIKLVGLQEFEIPKNVLDLVYSQTLCWLGGLFCPLIPPITALKFFMYFYFKKFTVLKNCLPPSRTYQAARANFFFMSILLVSFLICAVPFIYTITRIKPSQGCGPFRVYSDDNYYMFSAFSEWIHEWPEVLSDIVQFLGSWAFYIPLSIVLCLTIYYYVALAAGNRKMLDILEDQLALEGKDKQYLLNQVRQALLR